MVRSLAVSQRLLGTEEIILVHHVDCGMRGLHEEDVRQSLARVKASQFLPHRESVRGFVHDEKTGRLQEV